MYIVKYLNFIYNKRYSFFTINFILIMAIWAFKMPQILKSWNDKKAILEIFYGLLPFLIYFLVFYYLVFKGIPQYLWKSNFGRSLGGQQKRKLDELNNEIDSINSLWLDIKGGYLLTKGDPDTLITELKDISNSMTVIKSNLK